MSNLVELDEFKQQVADYFNQRINYDEGDFHPRLAHRLIEHAGIYTTFFAFGRKEHLSR